MDIRNYFNPVTNKKVFIIFYSLIPLLFLKLSLLIIY